MDAHGFIAAVQWENLPLATLLASPDLLTLGLSRSPSRLHLACMVGDEAVLARALAEGVDLHTLHAGQSPAMVAAMNGNDRCLRALLGAGADARAKDAKGWTCAHFAAERGHLAVLEALIHAGVDLGALDAEGLDPAGRARRCGRQAYAERAEAALLARRESDELRGSIGEPHASERISPRL